MNRHQLEDRLYDYLDNMDIDSYIDVILNGKQEVKTWKNITY